MRVANAYFVLTLVVSTFVVIVFVKTFGNGSNLPAKDEIDENSIREHPVVVTTKFADHLFKMNEFLSSQSYYKKLCDLDRYGRYKHALIHNFKFFCIVLLAFRLNFQI